MGDDSRETIGEFIVELDLDADTLELAVVFFTDWPDNESGGTVPSSVTVRLLATGSLLLSPLVGSRVSG